MYERFFKRIADFIIALIILPFWAVLILVIGPMIYHGDHGKIFYTANRLGKNGKLFKMYKFRTMKSGAPDLRNADGSTLNSDGDARLTPIGRFLRKTSIDETPQLINILRGEMSLIGPRPDLPEHRMMYSKEEAKKLSVKPGVTGFNQAYFRNSVPWKTRIENDIYYINHLSIWLDCKIAAKTTGMVICRKNIY